jgi:hypothetical protein
MRLIDAPLTTFGALLVKLFPGTDSLLYGGPSRTLASPGREAQRRTTEPPRLGMAEEKRSAMTAVSNESTPNILGKYIDGL